MQTSQEISNLFKALCECKKDFIPLSKSKHGYGYNYTPLDTIIDMLNTVLPKHGINFVQFPSTVGENYSLTTRVFHVSGEWMEDTIIFNLTEISKANDTQKLGASITYFRRYTLSSIFGIASDEDIDGNIEASIASQQQYRKKSFNEVKTTQQAEVQNSQKQKTEQEKLKDISFYRGNYDGVPLTDDESINAEIKKLVDEIYLGKPVFAEKQKTYIINKTSEILTKETYLSFLRKVSSSVKKRIEEESKDVGEQEN